MKSPDSASLLQTILDGDPRYQPEAYGLVRAGLDRTVRQLDTPRHISGQELLAGLRDLAIEEFGPMAKTTLNQWGVFRTEDFGEIVFNLVESGLLGKTDEDSREDFANGYDFDEAFRKPFQPTASSSRV